MSFFIVEVDGPVSLKPREPAAGFSRHFQSVSVTATTILDTLVIGNGKRVEVLDFLSASEAGTKGALFELYFSPLGSLPDAGATLLSFAVVNGSTFSKAVIAEFTGDGTAAILIVASVLGGGSRLLQAEWTGFLED